MIGRERTGILSPNHMAFRQSLASTKFRRDGSHFAIVWAIRAGIGRIRLAHTKAFVRAIRVGIGTGRLRDLAIRKWEPVSTKFRRFVGLSGYKYCVFPGSPPEIVQRCLNSVSGLVSKIWYRIPFDQSELSISKIPLTDSPRVRPGRDPGVNTPSVSRR